MTTAQIAQTADDVVAQAEAVLVDALFDEIVADLRPSAAAVVRAEPEPFDGCFGIASWSCREAVPGPPDDGPIRSPPHHG